MCSLLTSHSDYLHPQPCSQVPSLRSAYTSHRNLRFCCFLLHHLPNSSQQVNPLFSVCSLPSCWCNGNLQWLLSLLNSLLEHMYTVDPWRTRVWNLCIHLYLIWAVQGSTAGRESVYVVDLLKSCGCQLRGQQTPLTNPMLFKGQLYDSLPSKCQHRADTVYGWPKPALAQVPLVGQKEEDIP